MNFAMRFKKKGRGLFEGESMKAKDNAKSDDLRLVVFSFCVGVFLTGQVSGQETDAALEEIVVTGSHIPGQEFTTASPVQNVDMAEINSIGALEFKDVLKTVTANTGSQLADETSNGKGISQFSLRGLGLSSTLTLINGRRGGVTALTDAAGSEFVDINQFPMSMIERVEVLKDGSSATYGSEAVAGVVNFITRKGFEGFELSANVSDAVNESYAISMAAGLAFDRGSFNAYATYYSQSEIHRTDLDWYDERILGNGDRSLSRLLSTTGAPGSYLRAFINADGLPETVPGAQRVTDQDCLEAGGIFRQNPDGSFDTSRCRYDFSEQLVAAQEEDRLLFFTEFDLELSDNVTLYSEASFARKLARSPQGPNFYNNGTIVDTNRVYIPGDHPFNFYIADPNEPTAVQYIGPDDWDPAVHTGVDLACECRPLGAEFGGKNSIRERRQELNYERFVAGLNITLPNSWLLDTSYQFASNTANIRFGEEYRATVFNNLVIDGEFNPFGTRLANPDLISPKDGVSTAVNEQDIIDRFNQFRQELSVTEQSVFDLVATGELFQLDSGPVAIAIGGQYRDQSLLIMPDTLRSASEGNSPGVEFPVDDSADVWAVFAEAILPPLLNRTLDIQIAVRHEDFGDRAGTTTDPKIAVMFSPTDPIGFRASWGTSFQAPTLFQVAETGFGAIVDDTAVQGPGGAVCGPGGPTNLVNVFNSGSDLEPQSSENFNLGVVLQPVDALSVSLDYWVYDYTDLIAPSESAQAILINDCADDGIPNDPRVVRGATGQISRINTTSVNIGSVEASGFDLDLSYVLGPFGFDLIATYVNEFVVDDEQTSFDAVGSRNFLNNFGAQPQLRMNGSLSWQSGAHSANATIRYIDSYDNDQSNNAPIDSFTTLDLQYAIDMEGVIGDGDTTLRIGANNVLDEDPPALQRYDASGNLITGINAIDRPASDLTVHEIRGRVLYVGFTHLF